MRTKYPAESNSRMSNYNHWFIRARLKTRQLLLVIALAEESKIHRAADALNITQPAASKLLKDLEDVLGVPLFDRLPRGMVPTWYGEALIRHARVALSSLNLAYEEIQSLKEGRFGSVSVGAVTTPGIGVLPRAVAQVKKTHPTLRVSIQVDTSDVLHERLSTGKVDFLVARIFPTHDKTALHFDPLAEEPAVAAVRVGHPLLTATDLCLKDLVDWPWIVPPDGSVQRHRFDLMFHSGGLNPPTDIIETTAQLYITNMVVQCDAICLLAADVARYYASLGLVRVLGIHLPCEMDAFGLVTRTDTKLSPAATVMLAAIKRCAEEAYGVWSDTPDMGLPNDLLET